MVCMTCPNPSFSPPHRAKNGEWLPNSQAAARTAFQNFAKRYLADVDPKQAKKQQKYVKNRRRWARKDLVSSSVFCLRTS